MKPLRIKIEGVGVFRDSPLDLDLSGLAPGVYAIRGTNGAGKTTLMESMAPGPLMLEFPSREKARLPDWVGRSGGTIELDFELNGAEYKSRVKISTRGVTPLLLKNGEPVPGVTGKVKPYSQHIADLFGPRDAFYASIYSHQGDRGGFTSKQDFSVASRRQLFRRFLGLDFFESARLAAVRARDEIDTDEGSRTEELIAVLGERIEGLATEIDGVSGEVDAARATAKGSLESYRAAEDAVKWGAVFREYEEAATTGLGQADLVDQLSGELEELSLPPLDDLSADLLAASRKKSAAHREVTAAAESSRGAERDFAAASRAHEEGLRCIELLGGVPCGGNGKYAKCHLIGDAKLKVASLQDVKDTLEAAAERVNRLAEATGSAAALVCDATKKEVAASMALDRAKKMADGRDRLEKRLQRATSEMETSAALMESAWQRLPKDDDGDVDYSKAEVAGDASEIVREYKLAKIDLERLIAVRATKKEQLRNATEQLRQAEVRLGEAAVDLDRAEALGYLAVACQGVQAVELDLAGPRVSELVNNLLESCYGDRFVIEVITRRPKKRGDEFAETFDVIVEDTERSEHRAMGDISGGERTMVNEAVRIGLALYQREVMGLNFDTMFRDEPSGSLDAVNARLYARLLHRARALGDFDKIYFVTHSQHAAHAATDTIWVTASGARIGGTR